VSHSYAQNMVHVVFSTKGRCKAIDREFQPRLRAYIAGICKKTGIYLQSAGGTEDHLHLLIQVPPDLALAKAIAAIKASSSRWASEEGCKFAWQQGYGAFSVSASAVPTVDRYIQNQEQHHRKMDFEAEFLALLRKHGLQFDPKYVLG
jgi:putative transposase